MNGPHRRSAIVRILLVTLGATCYLLPASPAAHAVAAVRGFDGKTITVAGIGFKSQLPLVELGARARVAKFNETNEMKGIKLDYREFVDDKFDPATALSEVRRLVTQDQVFALVGDGSPVNPSEYLAQQHVPYFGGGFDKSYCSPRPSKSLWGFGFVGCISTFNPARVGDLGKLPYEYVTKTLKRSDPSIFVFGNDTDNAKSAVHDAAIGYQGAGFRVVGMQNKIPVQSPSDYTPYVQEMLVADHGAPPDAIACRLSIDCLHVWDLLSASSFDGAYFHPLLSSALVKPMAGSLAYTTAVNPIADDTPALRELKTWMDRVEAGSSAKIDFPTIAGWGSTDMFIQALKAVAKKGAKNITPENVRTYASTMTWKVEGLAGPTQYPQASMYSYPFCLTVAKSDGATWKTIEPFSCSTKTYSTKTKIKAG